MLDDATSPFQIYAGYSDPDLQVFDRFRGRTFEPAPGFVTDFLGVQTRTAFIAGLTAPQGALMGLPIPIDHIHAEAIEWIGLLKCVLAARDRFVAMELGAGWGPWIVAGAVAARHVGITDIQLTAVEADPGHVAFMQDHLRDNGLDPAAHALIQAAVGPQAGRARWHVCADPAADWGSRPVTDAGAATDHVGRPLETWLDIDIVAFCDLLVRQPVWDLVHIDVQGWEADLCRSAPALLDSRVRWLVIGTHDPHQHGLVMHQMHAQGWELENEKPPRMQWRSGAPTLQSMGTLDGTQVWRNPKLVP